MIAMAVGFATVVTWWVSGRAVTPTGALEVQWRWPLWGSLTVMRAYPRPGPAVGLEGRTYLDRVPLAGILLTRRVTAASDASGSRTIVYVHTVIGRR